jgi:hypothetical protein
VAFAGNFLPPQSKRVLTVANPGTQWQCLVNVHSFVHSKGDIHLNTVQGFRPTPQAPGVRPRTLVISRPSVPTFFRHMPNSSASTCPLSVTIFVRQWSSTLASHFGSLIRRSRNSMRWHEFAAELVVRLSGKQSTSTTSTDFGFPSLTQSREVDADPVDRKYHAC